MEKERKVNSIFHNILIVYVQADWTEIFLCIRFLKLQLQGSEERCPSFNDLLFGLFLILYAIGRSRSTYMVHMIPHESFAILSAT